MQFAHNGYYKGSTPLGLNITFYFFFISFYNYIFISFYLAITNLQIPIPIPIPSPKKGVFCELEMGYIFVNYFFFTVQKLINYLHSFY